MLNRVRRVVQDVLEFRLSIAELIGLAVLVGTPYLLIGLVWSTTHTGHLHGMRGVDVVVSFLGSIVCWPVLLFADVYMT